MASEQLERLAESLESLTWLVMGLDRSELVAGLRAVDVTANLLWVLATDGSDVDDGNGSDKEPQQTGVTR